MSWEDVDAGWGRHATAFAYLIENLHWREYQHLLQIPPTHLCRQGSLKPTGFFWVKLPLGRPHFAIDDVALSSMVECCPKNQGKPGLAKHPMTHGWSGCA